MTVRELRYTLDHYPDNAEVFICTDPTNTDGGRVQLYGIDSIYSQQSPPNGDMGVWLQMGEDK